MHTEDVKQNHSGSTCHPKESCKDPSLGVPDALIAAGPQSDKDAAPRGLAAGRSGHGKWRILSCA